MNRVLLFGLIKQEHGVEESKERERGRKKGPMDDWSLDLELVE